MERKNCWFWADEKVPEDERCLNVLCEECHKITPIGWKWNGVEKGYGPYKIVCDECGEVIHDIENS